MLPQVDLSPNRLPLPDGVPLDSVADNQGRIVQISDALAELSGYSVDELLGQSHRILRHPDMPKAAFTDMWQQLSQGLNWRGLVKNRCKNGDYYWFEAVITPVFEGERLIGFHAKRYPAAEKDIEAAERIYRQLI